MSKEVSIILPLYDSSPMLRKFTLNALKCIRENTDPEKYELIIVDNKVRGDAKKAQNKQIKANLYDLDYHGSKYLDINDESCTIIHNDPDIGYYASMNQGAEKATGKYLVFTQNDVMVPPNWLEDMKYYLDNDLADSVCPDMMPHGREWRVEHDKMNYEQNLCDGCIEAGLIMIKREAFDAIGGWDANLWQEHGWKHLFMSMGEKGYRMKSTYKVPIIHINQASRDGLEEEDAEMYKEIMHKDSEATAKFDHNYRHKRGIKHPDFDQYKDQGLV